MIVQWLIQVGTGFAGWVATLFPPVTVPSFLSDPSSGITAFLSSASGLGAWIPWAVILSCAAWLVLLYGVSFIAKLARAIIAHLPFIGGAG